MAISFFLKGNVTPIGTSFAYIVGFVVGVIFETDGIDASGATTNNLWIIWTVVYVCFIVIGVISERIFNSKSNK